MMACAVEAVPRVDEDDGGWADDEYLPEGAHWVEDCDTGQPWGLAGVSLTEAVEELHRQAHGGPLRLCRAEPCSRLELQQLDAIGASR